MQNAIKFLQKVISELRNKNISCMLVGGMALNIYAIPRMTMDFDIVIALEKKDVASFISIFEGNAYIYEPSVIEEIERQGMFNVIDWETSFRIDFIVLQSSEYSQFAFSRRKTDASLGFEIDVATIEDLIISKIAWIQQYQSEKQMNDIRLMLQKEVDMEYIKEWIAKLRLKTFNLLEI